MVLVVLIVVVVELLIVEVVVVVVVLIVIVVVVVLGRNGLMAALIPHPMTGITQRTRIPARQSTGVEQNALEQVELENSSRRASSSVNWSFMATGSLWLEGSQRCTAASCNTHAAWSQTA